MNGKIHELEVIVVILVLGMLTATGLHHYYKHRAEKYLSIQKECKYISSSEYYVMNHRHGRQGIVDSYKCPDGSIQKVYR